MIFIKNGMLVYYVYVMFADSILKEVSKDPSNINKYSNLGYSAKWTDLANIYLI